MGANSRKFTWLCDGHSRHFDLNPLLDELGFSHSLDVHVMMKDLSPTDAEQVKESTFYCREFENEIVSANILASAFDVSDEIAAYFHRLYLAPSQKHQTTIFAACTQDTDEAVGVGYMSALSGTSTVFLRVAGILPDYQRLGLYRILVRKRIEVAAAEGYTTAYVHAYSFEAAALLEKEGFNKMAEVSLHTGPSGK